MKRQTFRVRIRAHHVPPRWDVPEREFVHAAIDKRSALRRCVLWAASDAGIPPMKPLLRIVAEHASAEPHATT